jgi:hypothetical protein
MNPKRKCCRLIALVSLTLALSLAPVRELRAEPVKSASAAVRQVEHQTGGRVLKVTPGGNGYEVKVLLPNGVIRTVFVAGSK